MEIYEVLEAQARQLLVVAKQMRDEKIKSEFTFPEKLANLRGQRMSAADSIRLAFEYSKWAATDDGKAYISEHGDPYAEDRKQEIEATEWFAERETDALALMKQEGITPSLIREDIRPMMVFKAQEPPEGAGPDGQVSRMKPAA
jgi:hypothetical protein